MSELQHHGIRGQKWGEKHGPPYPLNPNPKKQSELKRKLSVKINQARRDKQSMSGKRAEYYRGERTIPAGTKINVYTEAKTKDNIPDAKTRLAGVYTKADKAAVITEHRENSDAKFYEHRFTAATDIKVPSRDTVKQVISAECRKNKAMINATVDAYINKYMPEGSRERKQHSKHLFFNKYNEKYFDKYVENMKKSFKNLTIDEAYFFASRTFMDKGTNDKLYDAVRKNLKNLGYDAMVNEAYVSGGGTKDTKGMVDPLIIFDPEVTLKEKKVKRTSKRMEKKADDRYTTFTKRRSENRSRKWSDQNRNVTFKTT